MLRGLVVTKTERLFAFYFAQAVRLARLLADAVEERARLVATVGTLQEQLCEAEAAIVAEQENAERLTDFCARAVAQLDDYERAFDDIVRPVKDPSAVIIVDPVGVPDKKRKRGEPFSLRKARRQADRRADEDAFRRNVVTGPPRKLPPSRVSAQERAAFAGATSPDQEG
jgi:hypothetical protein